MGAKVSDSAAPIAKYLRDTLKYRQRNSGDIDMVSSAASELEKYAKGEKDKKKQAAASKIAKELSSQASDMDKAYAANNKKIQTRIKEIEKL